MLTAKQTRHAMNFCSHCGAPVALTIPEGDTLPRYTCSTCQLIHYQNPKIVVGTIPELGEQILLCRRAIEPRYGLWTLPAGFMENHETTIEGAARETLEEAHANVVMGPLFSLFNLPHISQVYMMYRAQLLNLGFHAGTESLEVKLFGEHEVPWQELAFAVVHDILKLYFQDRNAGEFRFHVGEIRRSLSRL